MTFEKFCPRLFFGPAGTESKMHVDIWETDAWLGMLQGEKTFTLYHPAHRKFLEVGDNVWPDLLKPHNPARYTNTHTHTHTHTHTRARTHTHMYIYVGADAGGAHGLARV